MESLPIELMQTIAQHTDAATVLSLSTVSRRLRLVVRQRAVYQAVIDTSLLSALGRPSYWTQALSKIIAGDVRHWERVAVGDHLLSLQVYSGEYDYDAATRTKAFHFDVHSVSSLVAYLALLKHPVIYENTWVCDGLMGEYGSAETNFAHNLSALSIEDHRRWLYYSELSCSRIVYGTASEDKMHFPSFDIAMGILRECITYALQEDTDGVYIPGVLPLLDDLGIILPSSVAELPLGSLQEWHTKQVQRLLQDGLAGPWNGYICRKNVHLQMQANALQAEITISGLEDIIIATTEADGPSCQLRGQLQQTNAGEINLQAQGCLPGGLKASVDWNLVLTIFGLIGWAVIITDEGSVAEELAIEAVWLWRERDD